MKIIEIPFVASAWAEKIELRPTISLTPPAAS